jgi:hypothetical protein
MADVPSRKSGLPAQTLARFTAAEGRLYPSAAFDPEGYERGLELCSLLLTELRSSCPDIEAVLRRRDTLVTDLPARAAAAGLTPLGFEPETLVDAACAVRCREIGARTAAADHEARLSSAGAAGQEWLVDEPEPAAVMAGSYRRVEHHVPSGTMLVCTIEATPPGSVTYALEVMPGSGLVDESLESVHTFADRDEWLRVIEHYRSTISAVS